jgi:hypothetical protein
MPIFGANSGAVFMKSLQFSGFGNPADVIEVVDIPEPNPQAGEVVTEAKFFSSRRASESSR